MASMLVFLNKDTAALASQTNPQGIELYSYAKVFFWFAWLFVCSFRLRNMATDQVNQNQELVQANSTRVKMLFLAFPNGLLISQSIGCKDTRQSSRTFTFLCRASQISHLIEKKADIFLKRVSCSKNGFIDLCGCIFHYGRCTKI